jgi:hypothetical protein
LKGKAVDIKDPPSGVIEPARENNPRREDLRKAAAAWIVANPKVYALFQQFARQMSDRGRRFGIGLLAERVRWECMFVTAGGTHEYKINNNYRAYIARKLVQDDPFLTQFLRFRETKW